MLIAHLSDLHLRDHDDVIKLQRQLDRIVVREPDHLAITGDLLDRWSPRLLTAALEALARRGFLHRDKLTILHGNHDLVSSGGHPRRRADMWRLVVRFWDPPPLVHWRKGRFYGRLAAWAEGIGAPAPFCKTLPGGVRLATLDTVPIPWKPFSRNGRDLALQHAVGCMDRRQAEWLSGLQTPMGAVGPLLVLLHHYPLGVDAFRWQSPRWRVDVPMAIPPEDRKMFWDAASRAGVRLVLCGHVHRARLDRHDGIAVGLNGQSGADWAGRTIAYYQLDGADVRMATERGA